MYLAVTQAVRRVAPGRRRRTPGPGRPGRVGGGLARPRAGGSGLLYYGNLNECGGDSSCLMFRHWAKFAPAGLAVRVRDSVTRPGGPGLLSR
jgi:hypothetical protein